MDLFQPVIAEYGNKSTLYIVHKILQKAVWTDKNTFSKTYTCIQWYKSLWSHSQYFIHISYNSYEHKCHIKFSYHTCLPFDMIILKTDKDFIYDLRM
jgi:hypothetical protein